MLTSEFVAKVTDAGLRWEKIIDPDDLGIRVFVGRERHRVKVDTISETPEDKINSIIDQWKTQIKLYQDFDAIPERG